MSKNIAIAAGLLLAFAGAAHAQTAACSCDASATRISPAATLTTALANRMVCANVGSEVWQEWHNGTNSGPIVDYKLGPAHPRDPSSPVGTYAVNADATVTYTYGGTPYTYEVCQAASGTYTFCGANFGGRNITGARIGGSGLQSCSGVTSVGVIVRTIRN